MKIVASILLFVAGLALILMLLPKPQPAASGPDANVTALEFGDGLYLVIVFVLACNLYSIRNELGQHLRLSIAVTPNYPLLF